MGKTLDDPIAVGKDINALTGATVSSRAVTEAVRRGFCRCRSCLRKE